MCHGQVALQMNMWLIDDHTPIWHPTFDHGTYKQLWEQLLWQHCSLKSMAKGTFEQGRSAATHIPKL